MKKRRVVVSVYDILKTAVKEYIQDNAFTMGAALAYFTLFSLPALLLAILLVAGSFFGDDIVRSTILHQMEALGGKESTVGIEIMLNNVAKPQFSSFAAILTCVALLVSAGGVFVQLQYALNTVWGVKAKPSQGIKGFLRNRWGSFITVIGIGLLILIMLTLESFLTLFQQFLNIYFEGAWMIFIARITSLSISFFMMVTLICIVYSILPDVEINWRDVLFGAIFTSILLTLGKFLIGLYISYSNIASAYGAAGSMTILLIWIFLSMQIFLFGAEVTEVYAHKYGKKIVPGKYGIWINDPENPDEETDSMKV